MKKKFVEYSQAKKFIRSLGLKNQNEWNTFCKTDKKPEDIPNYPNESYSNTGWTSWGDFLGTGYIQTAKREYRKFEQVKKFVATLNLKNQREWIDFTKSKDFPKNIPKKPHHVYKNKGWSDWGNFLGTGYIYTGKRKYKSFEEAQNYVRSLQLKSQRSWNSYRISGQKPEDIPSNPNLIYKNKGWNGWGDWFGTGTVAPKNKNFRSFVDVKSFALGLKLENRKGWKSLLKEKKIPLDIPADPQQVYKNKGWTTWGDFLGTGNIRMTDKKFLPWSEAKKEYKLLAKKYGLKGPSDWKKFSASGKRPDHIPANPWIVYSKDRALNRRKRNERKNSKNK